MLYGWRQTRQTSWSHRAGIRLHPRCGVSLLVRTKHVVGLFLKSDQGQFLSAQHDLPSDLRRASLRFFSSSSFEERIDLTAGMKADCAVSKK
jgi:hypothetical protein